MSQAVLGTYAPNWEERHVALSKQLRTHWLAARALPRGAPSRVAHINDCHKILQDMRVVRLGRFRTVADVADMVLNKIQYQGMRRGIRVMALRPASSFNKVADVMSYYRGREAVLAQHERQQARIRAIPLNQRPRVEDEVARLDYLVWLNAAHTNVPEALKPLFAVPVLDVRVAASRRIGLL